MSKSVMGRSFTVTTTLCPSALASRDWNSQSGASKPKTISRFFILAKLQVRSDLTAAQRLEIDREHHRLSQSEIRISGIIFQIIDLEAEAVAVVGKTNRVAQKSIVLEIVPHRPEQAPSTAEIPARIAPNLFFVV